MIVPIPAGVPPANLPTRSKVRAERRHGEAGGVYERADAEEEDVHDGRGGREEQRGLVRRLAAREVDERRVVQHRDAAAGDVQPEGDGAEVEHREDEDRGGEDECGEREREQRSWQDECACHGAAVVSERQHAGLETTGHREDVRRTGDSELRDVDVAHRQD
ncbi:hypothetical protein EVG20_g2241 [Dentipellis fragilis]|uniref:Uncharacterized protein n=1 Tax=Dentipellis fragilis TaxID=205917 RepID=A0A4Y9Z7C4_9AGAM|nr:hypothetical protein EVG20_g2241 [Dentipellis fragilis]